MSKIRVLIIDDEPHIRKFLRIVLQTHDYETMEAINGQEGMTIFNSVKPDLVILDLGLPDIDGIELIKMIREWSETPIIVLSVRENEKDKISALDSGADDYLTKPFGVGELLARLRAAMRHNVRSDGEPFIFGNLTVDLEKRSVTVQSKEVKLTPIEYTLLKILILNSGKVLTHNQLLKTVWGVGYENDFHLLHVHINNLRKKIEEDPTRPKHILNEAGIGYRFK